MTVQVAHGITIDYLRWPHSRQFSVQCTCGWLRIAVTDTQAERYLHAHHKEVKQHG